MGTSTEMDALILAGGKNKRFGVFKCFIKVRHRRIIDTNYQILKKTFRRIFISSNQPESLFYMRSPIIGDVVENKGPMSGILSVLLLPDVKDIFVSACDMPFLNPDLMHYMKNKWNDSWDALIPMFKGEPQPLFGIYSKRTAEFMEKSLRDNKRSLRDFLCRINVLYIQEIDVRKMDPEGMSFININTKEDFKQEIGGAICLD